MPVITLPDGSTRSYETPVSVMHVAADIGAGLAKATLAGRVNGELGRCQFYHAGMIPHSLLLPVVMRMRSSCFDMMQRM